ncbi:MAG: DUF3572 family protein [Pseudolabrys sp.]|nr:DUF3572 family protein [Pseudolabrys sp.]
MKTRRIVTPEAAEGLAIQALSFIAADSERLGRFLAVTGIGPTEIRAASREPRFLAGVLEYLASDERLASAFTAEAACDPADLAKAHIALGGVPWEREIR